MSQRDVILSMVEAVSCTLNEANSSEVTQAQQFDIVLRAIPFFNEILSMVNSTTAHQLPELRTTVNNFLSSCNRCMIFISKEASLDYLNLFIDFLDSLISSCLVSECIDSMSQLLVGILNTRDIPKERVSLFSKIFKTFFLASDLRSEFIKGDGILTAWFTYVAEPENPLILQVFELFETYLEFFALPDFSSHITDLIAAVSASFSSLNLNSAKFVFTFIQKIVAFNPKFYIQKLDENLFFQSIYLFIIQHQDDDPNLISYLEFFTTLIPFSAVNRKPSANGKNESPIKIPSLDMTINIISSMECKIPLRHRALKGIENILRYVTIENMPFSTDQISLIANAIPIDDAESVYIFSTICLDLNIQANFDISPLIPFLQRFMTIDLLLKIDMTKYISLFLEYQQEVSPFMPALYISVFKKLTPELFSDLVNRYGHLFAFIFQHFTEPLTLEQLDEFMKLLIIAFPYYHDVGGAESCLTNIISAKKGYLFTHAIFEAIEKIASTTYLCDGNGLIITSKNEEGKTEEKAISPSISSSDFGNQNQNLQPIDKLSNKRYDVSGLLRALTKTLKDSFSFRSECINQEVYLRVIDFYNKFGIAGHIILDFLSALTNHIYVPLLDAAVYLKLKEINYMNMNKQQLLRFALGLQQTEKTFHVLSENQANLSGDLNLPSSKESSSNAFEPAELAKQETESKQPGPILTFLLNEEDQTKEIPIDDGIENISIQNFDHTKIKQSPSKVSIIDLNEGFSETSDLSDQNSSSVTSNASIRKYSSSFTPQNIFGESIQGNFFNIPSAFDDDAIATKTSLPVNQTNQKSQFEIEQSNEKKTKHSSRRKKRTHTHSNGDKTITTASIPHGALCFPSILGQCDDYVFTSRYDLWVCGRVGLTAWLRDSGRPISEFPSIVNVASQYARREHLEMLIDYPQIFYKTCANLAKLPPLFEFKKSFDCSFSVSPSSSSNSPYLATPGFAFQIIKSFCLWFQVSENVSDVTNFLTINSNIQLFLLNHEILFEGNPIGSYEVGKWVFFAATSEPQSTTIDIYLDLKLIYKIQNKYGFNPTPNCKSIVTFGGKHCCSTWFIGGTIRFFSEPATSDLLLRVYNAGVSSVLSLDQLNINANNRTSSFETIRKSATMSAPLFGDEYIQIQSEGHDENDFVTYIGNALQFANIVNGSYLDRRERPVPIYSLLNYIQNVKTKPIFLIKRILELIQKEDYENANYLLKSFCLLKKNKIIKQSNESFALSISILYHIAPDILTDDTIDLIISCFERNSRIAIIKDKNHTHEDKNVGYDWNSFFVFAFDYSLMFSKYSVVFISKFFELNARYPIIDEMSRYSFTLYLFSLLLIPEFDKSLNESILDFILKLNPDSSLIFFLLASYPNMAVAISDNSQPYSFIEEDNTILLILKLISNLKIRQFNYYVLLNVLPSSMSCKLARTLAEQHLKTIYQQQQQPQGRLKNTSNSNQYGLQPNSIFFMHSSPPGSYMLETLDYNEIFESLLHTVFMPESWFSAISICTNSLNIDDLHNFTLNHFDMNLFEPFFKMFTLLSCACFRINNDSFWIRFAALLSEQMILIIPSIPEKIITKTLKFWVLQLMTFGQPFDKMSTFPPYPLAFTSRDVLEYIEIREQKYPTNYGKPFTFQPVSFPFSSSKNSNNNPKVYNEMFDQVCNYVDYVSPKIFCLNGVAKYHVHHKRHQKVFKEIFDANVTYIAKDWVEYINNIIENFDLDKDLISVKEHPLTDILIRLLSSFVVHCPPLFHTIFNTMSIFPNDLMMILVHKITICSLNLCEHQRIFHQQLIDIACKRAMEGWYTPQYVSIIQQIFKIVNQCFFNDSNSSNSKDPNSNNNPSFQLPVSFYNAIIFGFDVIPGNDVPKLLNIISNNRQIFINQSFVMNFDLCISFISQMLKYINILTNTFYQLWSYFVSLIKSLDQFQIQWNKTYGPQQSKLIVSQQNSQADAVDFSSFFSFLTMIEKNGAKGFDSWTKKNSKAYVPLEKLLQTTLNNYHQQVLNEIATEIDSLVKIRNEKSVEFIRISNSIIIERSKKVTCCKAKAACLRQIYREHFIFMNLFFIRRRENHASTLIPINFNNKESGKMRKAISILSDPIFPSRRLEKSPLGYVIPSFPDGTYSELFPEKPSTLPVFDDINYSSSIRELFSYETIQVPFLLRYSPFQLHAKFTQFLPIQPYQNLALLSLLINKGSNFQHICNCSLLYGIETLNGCLFICENTMYFGEGFMIDEENKHNGFTFINQNQSLPYFFYLQNIMTNHFGKYYLYQGHPIIEWPFDDIICAYPHIWIHKPYSIVLNFTRGFNFVLNFKKVDYNYVFPLLKRYSSSFFDSAPPISSIQTIQSVINSARYLQLTNKEVTSKWQNGEIDTFTYLCILNRLGKRPTCDMTQYPVFPWIISDFESNVINLYSKEKDTNEDLNKGPSTSNHKNPCFRDLSLPMGQIGKKRSERFNEFYKDTNNQYYYGTHYMHYGVVLYFMFRVDPFTFFSIELNKGWDHPNRVFYNMADSWKSAAFSSPTDIKEVIPQFFLVPEIFNNTSHLPLTTNDDGISIASVKLPNWAKNARDMSDILLKLMECDYVQKNINFWVDLIFGDKSRGQGARDVKNLFHPLCYAPMKKHREAGNEDGDPDNLEDDVSREASIISIINFGQCPQQVMNKPHPQIKYSKYWRILSSPIISPSIMSSIESLSQASKEQLLQQQQQQIQLQQQQKNETEDSASSQSAQSSDETSQTNENKTTTTTNVTNNNNGGGGDNDSSNNQSLMMLSEMISHAPMSLTSNWQRLRTDSFFMPPYASYCDNSNTALTSNHRISAFIPPTGQILYVEDGAVMLTNKNLNEAYKLSESDIFHTTSAVAFSSDGLYLTMALRDGSLMLYKLLYVKGEARYPKILHVFSAYDEIEELENETENKNLPLKPSHYSENDSMLSSSYSTENMINHTEKYKERVHDIVSICVSSEHFIAFAASGNRVVQFDIGLYKNLPPIKLDFAVKKVDVDDHAALLFATGDYEIAVISISGEVLMTKKIENQPEMAITCMTPSKLPQYFIGRFLSTGHINGKLCFWSVSYSKNELQQIGWVKLSDDPISSICLSSNSQRLIAGTKSEIFSCECQNINGGINKNLVNAIRIASQIMTKNNNNAASSDNQQQQQQKVLDLHENDDGFVVIDINKSNNGIDNSIGGGHSLTTPIMGFESKTCFVPFVDAASGSTGGFITGSITNIGGGSGGGSNVSCIPLKKETYATECASCHCDIKKNAFVCGKCGRFFCQRCITKEINALKTSITCVLCMPPQSNIDGAAQTNS